LAARTAMKHSRRACATCFAACMAIHDIWAPLRAAFER
jgi:hypothetical protein